MLISVSGPTKTGKTVLVNRVAGGESIVSIAGSAIERAADVWRRAGEEEGVGSGEPFSDTVEALVASERVLIIDDFHYVDREVQARIAQQLKDAIARGLKCIIISVPHRSDDPIRANPDLRGRVRTVDLGYWEPEQLSSIADRGFPLLNVGLSTGTRARLAEQSLRTPQLMQLICLEVCRYFGIAGVSEAMRNLTIEDSEFRSIGSTVAEYANAQTSYAILREGPALRGQERTRYRLRDGSSGDVYQILLDAIANDPPLLSLTLTELKRRVAEVVPGQPGGGLAGRVATSVKHMDKLMRERPYPDRVIEWDADRQTLDVLDPYFLYYARWGV